MSWIDALKIAVINENTTQIDDLFAAYPGYENIEDVKEASALVDTALQILKAKRSETLELMRQLEVSRNYIAQSYS